MGKSLVLLFSFDLHRFICKDLGGLYKQMIKKKLFIQFKIFVMFANYYTKCSVHRVDAWPLKRKMYLLYLSNFILDGCIQAKCFLSLSRGSASRLHLRLSAVKPSNVYCKHRGSWWKHHMSIFLFFKDVFRLVLLCVCVTVYLFFICKLEW